MKWQVLNTGVSSAENNMKLDEDLLRNLGNDPILHFYDWERDSATYGHFIKPQNFLNFASMDERPLDLARRPTGGGITFHLADLAYSVLIPASHPGYSVNIMENYAYVNHRVSKAVAEFLGQKNISLLSEEVPADDYLGTQFCMAKPTKYDVMFGERKVGGGAQRKTKEGFLHQGTLSLGFPNELFLQEILLPGTLVLECMKKNSYYMLGEKYSDKDLEQARQELRKLLEKVFLSDNLLD
jgi:lipoate-protein ligase A